jgi:ABC-type transport system involved in Fe-S cluster assembly fused permease/ATPase subunit
LEIKLTNFSPLVLGLIVAFGYITYQFDVYVGLILAATYMAYSIVTYKGTVLVKGTRRTLQATKRVEQDIVFETIANWIAAFYTNRQAYQRHRVEEVTRQEVEEAQIFYDMDQAMHVLQTLVMCTGYSASLFRAAFLVVERQRTVGDFVTLLFYWAVVTKPLVKLSKTYKDFSLLFIDAERLLEIHQTKPAIIDAPEAEDLVFRGGKVEYRNVSFSYDGRTTILKDLNFESAHDQL